MIVVVGRPGQDAVRAVAVAAAARGVSCELVGAVPPDTAGDRLLQRLARAGVGHAAVLRTVAGDLEPADLELALRYLPDTRVIVLVDDDGLADVAESAASWAGATLVRITGPALEAPPRAGERTLVLAAPARDPDAAFAGLVGALAARLEAGEPLEGAWPATLAAVGAEAVRAKAIEADASGRPPISDREEDPPARPAARGRPAAARSAPRGPDRRSGHR